MRHTYLGQRKRVLACVMLAATGLLNACSSAEPVVGQSGEGGVESRAVGQLQRPMQPGMAMKPGMPAQPGVPAQANIQLPTWPQKWDANNREPYGIAFGVTQPGPVTVDVQAQGAPVVVSLLGAALQPVQQQSGSGPIRITYQVTPADVQRGALWQVRIALAQAGGPPAQAAGTVAVQHPPADVNVVRMQTQAQRSVPNPQAEASMAGRPDTLFQAEMAKFQQEQMAHRAANTAGVQAKLQAFQMQRQGSIKPRGLEAGESGSEPATTQATEPAVPPADEGDVTTRGGMKIVAPKQSATGATLYDPGTFKLPAPEIEWFSPMTGRPGDQVGIAVLNLGSPSPATTVTFRFTGSASPGSQQAVTYASCPSAPYTAPIIQQNPWWILVSVPEISGVIYECPFSITVTRGSDGQTTAPIYGFQFKPAMEMTELKVPPHWQDSNVHFPFPSQAAQASIYIDGIPPGWRLLRGGCVETGVAGLFGDKGNDTFFMNKSLKNAWKVKSVVVEEIYPGPGSGAAGAYLWESRIGTSSPYVNVRTWQTPNSSIIYKPRVFIEGPRGVPYE